MGAYHPHERDDLPRVPDPSDPANQEQQIPEMEELVEFNLDLHHPHQHGEMVFVEETDDALREHSSDLDPSPEDNQTSDDTQPEPTVTLHADVADGSFQPTLSSYGSMRVHFTTPEQTASAIREAEERLHHEFQHHAVFDRVERERKRLMGAVEFTNIIKIPKSKKYADELVHKIAMQMVRQVEGEASARAVNYLSSLPLVKQFLQNTTEGFQVVLGILRDCNVRVPLRIGFDPRTRELEREYLDFRDGDSYTIDQIVQGLVYLHAEYGPNSRRVKEAEALIRQTTDVNRKLKDQYETLAREYQSVTAELARLRVIEHQHKQIVLEPLRDTERQYVIFRAYMAEAKPSRRQRRERKAIDRINREHLRDVTNEHLRRVAPLPNIPLMPLEHDPLMQRKGAWIGLTDPDDRNLADRNELDPGKYESVSNIGEALKLPSYEAAQAVLDKLITTRRDAKKKGRKSLYKGPKNPHHFAVYQIIMRKA